jgi:hypothetical protein
MDRRRRVPEYIQGASCLNWSDALVAEGLGDGFGLRVDLKFAVDVLEMEGDGADADGEAGALSLTLPSPLLQTFFNNNGLFPASARRENRFSGPVEPYPPQYTVIGVIKCPPGPRNVSLGVVLLNVS